jgi:transaldolase
VGRLDDISEDGMGLIENIMDVWMQQGYKTEVLVASVRHPLHVTEAARIGAHIATIPYDLFPKLAKHPLTDAGLKKFLEDWEKVQK